jgi:hypothetical protein
MKKAIFCIGILATLFSQNGKASDHKSAVKLTDEAIRKHLSCAPPLISSFITESGFATEVRLSYGPFEFVRTDIGDPSGNLIIKKNGKELCTIALSIAPEIYFSGINNLLVLEGSSGSNDWYSLYSLKNDTCSHVGDTFDKKSYDLVKKLLIAKNGQIACEKVRR